MDNRFFKEVLKGFDNGCELTDEVVNLILSHGGNQPIDFICDVLNQGIEDIMTNRIEVIDFFEYHYNDIFNLYNNHKIRFGKYPYLNEVNQFNLVYFAIEDIMRELVDKLDIDLDRRVNNKFTTYCECIEVLMHLDSNSDFDLILKDNDYNLESSYSELIDTLKRIISDYEEIEEDEEIIKSYRDVLEMLL